MPYTRLNRAFLHTLSIITVFTLQACGSSDNDSSDTGSGTGGGAVVTYALSGTIDNLRRGDLTVKAEVDSESESQTFTSEDSFAFSTDFAEGTVVSLSVTSQPVGQECSLSTTSITLNSDVTDLAITCADIEYSVTGSVSEVAPESFVMTVSGDRVASVDLQAGTAFTAVTDIIYEQSITLAIDDTPGYDCAVTPASVTVTEDVTDIDVTCTSIGSVNGVVTNYITGEVVSDATISVYSLNDGNEYLYASTTPDENGLYEMHGIDTTAGFYVRAESDNYVVDVDRFIANSQRERVLNIALFPVNYSTTFGLTDTIAMGASAEANVNIVEIPSSSLVAADGSSPTGEVTATLTVIDPSLYVEAMPGLYTTSNSETGEIEPIESFGAFSLTLNDEQGADLDLVDGTSATVRIPLATGVSSAPSTIPLYYFDESSALWVEEGEATLTTIDGEQFYVGTVTHFTTWNADQVYNTVNISGCVVDSEGTPLPYAQVLSEGANYVGRSSTYTNAEGDFTLPVRANSSLLIFARDTGQTNTVSISSSSIDTTLDNCLVIGDSTAIVKLTWGANPSDLDTHFTGPTAVDSDDRFHIYYSHKNETVGDVVFNLDVDDVSSYGPEILTVPSFSIPGRYRYSVYHYSGSETIATSPTRVELRLDDRTYVFNPSEEVDSYDSNYRMWVVFDLVVDDDLAVTVVEINQHTSSAGSETLGVEGFSSNKFGAQQLAPMPAKIY